MKKNKFFKRIIVLQCYLGIASILFNSCGDKNHFWDNNIAEDWNLGIGIQSITINPPGDNIVIGVDSTITLTTIVEPANATNKKVIWSSDNENIATVDQAGVVIGISAGMTFIYAVPEINTDYYDYGFSRSRKDITVVPQ